MIPSFEIRVYEDRNGHVRVGLTLPSGERVPATRLQFVEGQALRTLVTAIAPFPSELIPQLAEKRFLGE